MTDSQLRGCILVCIAHSLHITVFNVARSAVEPQMHATRVQLIRQIDHKYKKLCYCRGTARRAKLVNSCYVSPGMEVRKVSNSKSDLQGHSRTSAMVPFYRPHAISFDFVLPLQLCLYLAPFTIYYYLFPKI